jgi:hypothetical protein
VGCSECFPLLHPGLHLGSGEAVYVVSIFPFLVPRSIAQKGRERRHCRFLVLVVLSFNLAVAAVLALLLRNV